MELINIFKVSLSINKIENIISKGNGDRFCKLVTFIQNDENRK